MGHKRILRRIGKTEAEISDICNGEIVVPKDSYDDMMRKFKLNKWKKQYLWDKWGNRDKVILKNGEMYEASTNRRVRANSENETAKSDWSKR